MHLSLAVLAMKRLKPTGMSWCAPECGSLGFMNRGTSDRSVWNTIGNVNIQSVRIGTMLVNRTAIVSECWGLTVYICPWWFPYKVQCFWSFSCYSMSGYAWKFAAHLQTRSLLLSRLAVWKCAMFVIESCGTSVLASFPRAQDFCADYEACWSTV